MRYIKPDLHGYPALRTIQSGGQSKKIGSLEMDQRPTASAYEADE
jgi:hypothetical protein